jgi:uncharacterized membrane protein YhaH (DUF805 family)
MWNFLKDLFTWKWRWNRKKFLLFYLFLFLFAIIWDLINLNDLMESFYNMLNEKISFLIWIIFLFLFLYLFIVIHIKRLHDLNNSGWWTMLIPLISVPLLIYCGFFRWTSGDNRFGPDPLGWKASKTNNWTPNEL